MLSWLTALAVLGTAILIDLLLGEPPTRLHPSAWIGNLIEFIRRRYLSTAAKRQHLYGIILALGVVALSAGVSYEAWKLIGNIQVEWIRILLWAILLKPTFSFRLMANYSLRMASAINRGDARQASILLRNIVRRDTTNLTITQMISAGVESVAENTTDGIISPLFYYALFGIPGAFAYRAVNTLDAIIGYKDPELAHIGWFSARLDSLANWIPARITAVITILSAWLLHESPHGSFRILSRDRNRTESWNAGWTMSSMAGALEVQLEKTGHYTIGDATQPLTQSHLITAVRIMALNTILFIALVVTPILIIL